MVLHFLAEMRCCWEPDLAVLLGRQAGRAPLGSSGTRDVVGRWSRAGWVTAQKVWVARPRVVSLTPLGASLVAEEARYRPAAWPTLQHTAEVARARLWLEGRSSAWGPLVGWTSESEYRRARYTPAGGAEPGHYPDGIAAFELQTEVAIEVELTPKPPATLDGIVESLALSWPHIVYFVASGRVRAGVEGAYGRLVDAGRVPAGRVTVLDLPAVAA